MEAAGLGDGDGSGAGAAADLQRAARASGRGLRTDQGRASEPSTTNGTRAPLAGARFRPGPPARPTARRAPQARPRPGPDAHWREIGAASPGQCPAQKPQGATPASPGTSGNPSAIVDADRGPSRMLARPPRRTGHWLRRRTADVTGTTTHLEPRNPSTRPERPKSLQGHPAQRRLHAARIRREGAEGRVPHGRATKPTP
jgi:hypothetical protein